MTSKPRTPAYFAVARGIGDHPLFRWGQRRLSRREAFETLIELAAWKAKGHRHLYGVVDLARGQLSLTVRELAAVWRWPPTNVHRYLRRLQREGMCNLEASGTSSGRIPGRARLVITICNYGKYQPAVGRVAHHAEHQPEQIAPQLPGIVTENIAEARESIKSQEKEAASTIRARQKPRHGRRANTADGPMVWVDHGTQEWDIHAKDYQSVRNVAILPKVYQGGRGNWFMVHGEAARNRSQIRRTAQGR